MMFSLLQPLREIPIAVIDTETTGASAALGHKIIEVGIVRLEEGRPVARYEQLIDPVRPIGPGVTALTGISQAMVQGQGRFADHLPRMLQLLQGAAVLGHNIRFDLSFLHAEFRRCGMSMAETLGQVPVLDTVRIARRRFGRGGNALPLLSRRLGVDPVVSHRALADAVTTAGVFEKLMDPVGGWGMTLCDCLAAQGGNVDMTAIGGESLLPLELEEALELARPVTMEYLDARGARTLRIIEPLHVRRSRGELLLVAHCRLRQARRTFKVERIVQLRRWDPNDPAVAAAEECDAESTGDEA